MSIFSKHKINQGFCQCLKWPNPKLAVAFISAMLLAPMSVQAEEDDVVLEIEPQQQGVELGRESAAFNPEESLEDRSAISGSRSDGEMNMLNRVVDNVRNLPTSSSGAADGISTGSSVNFAGSRLNQAVTGNTVINR